METKVCSTCLQTKSKDQFYGTPVNKDRLANKCKPCYNEYTNRVRKKLPNREIRAANHHLTLEEFDLLEQQFNGGCWICKRSDKLLVVDHDHGCCPGRYSCGKCVRGLLCTGCNNGLGGLGDSIEGLSQATNYLTNYNERRK